MERIADLAASVLANPGVCQEIRDISGKPVFYAVTPAVYDRYVRAHVQGGVPKAQPRKPRPAGKQSYRQRHARRAA